jgi:HD-GYP domain-containing protein (c-di-GMP phosphodiesterase class II)
MLVELSAAVESRDPATRGHAARVTVLADAVGRRLGWDEPRLAALRLGATLHDVGKVAVPVAVLRKRGPLTEAEAAQVRVHPAAGACVVAAIAAARPALPCVLHHHERWDGRGYPHGLEATEIPHEARLLAVADAYDAMTTSRPYRAALPAAAALAELERCAGTQFDPHLVGAFLDVWAGGARVSRAALDPPRAVRRSARPAPA